MMREVGSMALDARRLGLSSVEGLVCAGVEGLMDMCAGICALSKA